VAIKRSRIKRRPRRVMRRQLPRGDVPLPARPYAAVPQRFSLCPRGDARGVYPSQSCSCPRAARCFHRARPTCRLLSARALPDLRFLRRVINRLLPNAPTQKRRSIRGTLTAAPGIYSWAIRAAGEPCVSHRPILPWVLCALSGCRTHAKCGRAACRAACTIRQSLRAAILITAPIRS
jgi:hypothetical protein